MKRVLIMGAAGRDFHNFNVLFRNNPDYRVVCFTAAQIPNIEDRIYPPALAGKMYPKGIPIYPEQDLSRLVKEYDIDEVILSYSDLSHQDVMKKASLALASGADFRLVSPNETMLESSKPVIAVTAVRTGAGKSPLTRFIVKKLIDEKRTVAVVRHPMPYGNLEDMAVQRFASLEDIDKAKCTIEEREEYEPLVNLGVVVHAGIDYGKILRGVEREADIIVWDGGNNDTPFFRPDLHVVVCDALRPGHEVSYYPGLVNLILADVVLINKVDMAKRKAVETIVSNIKEYNNTAFVMKGRLKIKPATDTLLRGKRGIVIEDGPTVTHGGLKHGAGYILAKRKGIRPINVKQYIGKRSDLAKVFEAYAHLDGSVLPALGYSMKEVRKLERIIKSAKPDVVVLGTPIDISRVLNLSSGCHVLRATYELRLLTGEKRFERMIKNLL